ncbi:MAG: Carboxypeptidase precursor [Frankiales bacterium]|nr:Carboxypeptidase precursor [Frankiales bacterium]
MTETGISRRSLFRTAGAVAAVGAIGAGTAARAAGPSALDPTAVEPLRLARVWAVGRSQLAQLAGFDDTHVVHPDGAVEVLLWPGDLARLRATGLRFQVDVDDLVARDAALPRVPRVVAAQPGETSTGDYRVLEDYERDMRALVKRFPTKARLVELPHRTLEGRTVYGLEVCTDVGRRDGRPVFYQDGCHHAREWPAAEVPLMWAYDLLENSGKDARLQAILDHVRTIVVPVVNVDGFAYTRSLPPVETGEVGGVTNPLPPEAILLGGQGRYVRKNRRPLLGSDLGVGQGGAVAKPLPLDAVGVDPNRNYAYSWGDDEGGSSSDATSQTYRGTDPFSEQESKNVAGLLKSHQVLAMVTHHTSGDLLLWAWGDTRADAPDNALLEGFGRAMATYNGYVPQKSIDLYVTTGTTSDYAYGVLGSIGYTFEHAGSSFHPPYEDTVPAMYDRNREAFILLALHACLAPEQRPAARLTTAAKAELAKQGQKGQLTHGILSGRAVDRRGRPVTATLTLTKTFDTLLWAQGAGNPLGQRAYSETIAATMTTGADGRFAWHVNPSTRPIVAAAKKTESWLLTVTGPDGVGVSRRLVVARGQRVDLGSVVVG